MTTRFNFTLADEARELFEAEQERLRDLSVPMHRLAVEMERLVLERFDRGGDGLWPPHAESTVERHGRHDLLNWTGGLRESIEPDWDAFSARVKSAAPHAHLHQFGTRSPVDVGAAGKRRSSPGLLGEMNIPERELLFISPKVEEQIDDFVLGYLFDGR